MEWSDGEVAGLIIFFVFLGMLVGALIQASIGQGEVETMGQMICDEKGYGDFVTLDKDEKTVKCEPKKQKERFDGGYIEVTNLDNYE